MKKSNIILVSIIVALILGSISYAFVIKKKALPTKRSMSQSLLEGKGSYFEDTKTSPYKVIRSNFPVIFLDARYKDTLIVDGYENARDFIDYYVHGDTLEIFNSNLTSPNKIADGKINSEYTLKVTVGAKNLKGLWLYGEGAVVHDARPTGARMDGSSVYSPSVIAQYKLDLDDIDITIRDKAKFSLFLSAKHINLDYNYSGSTSTTSTSTSMTPGGFIGAVYQSNLNFMGEAEALSIVSPNGAVGIVAQDLELDSLIIVDNAKYCRGSVYANPRKYLKAELQNNMDVFYDGAAQEKDILETGWGRTINRNTAFFAGQDNESRKRTADLVKTAQDIAAQVKDGSLRMLSTTELVDHIRSNNGRLMMTRPIYKDMNGKVLDKTARNQAAIDSLGADYYADSDGEIKEVVFRPRTDKDNILRKEVQSVRKREISIKNRFVNCNDIKPDLDKIPIEDHQEKITLVVNVLRKCGMPSTQETGASPTDILTVFQQAPLQYRKQYQSLITETASSANLSNASLDNFRKGIEIDESIMKTYFEYPRKADQDNDQLIYEQILKISNDTQRETLGLESLETLLNRIGIKYQVQAS